MDEQDMDEQDQQREREEQDWQHKRDDLLDRVKRGELTGEEADTEAEKLGPAPRSKRLARFSTRPADDEFRPERMGEWTLTMALAWILYGDLDEVREWHAPYLAECRRWGHTDAGGWELKPPHAPTFVLLLTSVAMGRVGVNGSKASMSGRAAEEQLWAMLQGGKLKATGIDTTTKQKRPVHKRPVNIPAREWRELNLVVPDVKGPGAVDEVRRSGGLGEGYREVLVRSADVRRGFPAPGEKPILAGTKAETPTPKEAPKHPGGRSTKYLWDRIAGEVFRRVWVDNLPENYQHFAKEIFEWCEQEFGKDNAPDTDNLRKHIGRWLAGVKREEK